MPFGNTVFADFINRRDLLTAINNIVCCFFIAAMGAYHYADTGSFVWFITLSIIGLVTVAVCVLFFSLTKTKYTGCNVTGGTCLINAPLVLFLMISASVFSHLITHTIPLWPYMGKGQVVVTGDITWLYCLFHLVYSTVSALF